MAFPNNIADITTNLNESELTEVVRAIENKEVDWEEGRVGFTKPPAGFTGYFSYNGSQYEMFEDWEIVKEIKRL